MHAELTIRNERPGDEAAIFAVHAAAFPSDAEARLVDALRAAGRLVISLVAEIEGRIVGHVAFSPVTVDGAESVPSQGVGGVGLAPVAVLPECQRRGIAAALIEQGLAECRRQECGYVVVLGDPHYYGRFGFRPAAGWGLSDEYGGGEAFQAMELRPGTIPRGGGLVQYAEEFGAA